MRDYTAIYSDILFYTKEYERLCTEIKNAALSDGARKKLEGEIAKTKAKLDALTEKIPEISENL